MIEGFIGPLSDLRLDLNRDRGVGELLWTYSRLRRELRLLYFSTRKTLHDNDYK